MSMSEIELDRLPVGGSALVVTVKKEGAGRDRLLDLGLVPSTIVEAIRRSPAGDPVAYKVRGATIALRSEESRLITVSPLAPQAMPEDQGKWA